jgi:hypothetical protein
MSEAVDMTKFGGTLEQQGPGFLGGEVWNFGYVEPAKRSDIENAADELARQMMVEFSVGGNWNDDEELVALWKCAMAANGGKHFLAFWQQTGSCVGNGLGQATWNLSAVEVVRLGDPEQVILPFYLLPYGRSRFYGGMRGRGEGSFGSTAAKAIMVDGILPYNTEGLEQPTMDEEDGITWGRNAELKWSDGAAISASWLEKSRKHLVKSAANIPNADAAWEALSNYYPLTLASDWGGEMRPSVQSDPPCLLNRRVTTWMHQMSCIARWRHPKLGKLFYILNSWGPKTHGICPSGAQPGGFWISFKDMDYICKQREVFALSQFSGFPAQAFRWSV